MFEMNSKKHYANAKQQGGQEENQFQHTQLRNKSVFNPKVANNHFSEVFKNLVEQDLDELKIVSGRRKQYIEQGLKALEKNKRWL